MVLDASNEDGNDSLQNMGHASAVALDAAHTRLPHGTAKVTWQRQNIGHRIGKIRIARHGMAGTCGMVKFSKILLLIWQSHATCPYTNVEGIG